MLTKENFTWWVGTIFLICWTSWISRCFPAAIFFYTECSVSCPREFRKVPWKRDRQWQSQSPWTWCQRTSWDWRKILRKSWVIQTARTIKNLDQNGVLARSRKLLRDTNQSPTMYSQARQQGDTQSSSTGKQERRDKPSSSARARKLSARREHNQFGKSKFHFHNMQISTYWSGDCTCRQQWKPPFTWGHNYTMSIRQYAGTRTSRNFKIYSILLRVGTAPPSEDSECEDDWMDSSLMDEIHTYARPCDHVDESESTRRLRFRLMLGEMSDHSKANRRWERQGRLSRRIICSWWRTDWVRVKNFPGLTSLDILQKIQEDLQDRNIESEKFEVRSIFMSMFNDMEWTKEIQKNVLQIPNKSMITRRDSREDIGHSSAPETKKKWYGTENHLLEGK